MRRTVEIYAEQTNPAPGEPPWACGSGYLIGGHLVLTAAHVVTASEPPAQIRVMAPGLDLAAEIAWLPVGAGAPDMALLRITEPAWTVPTWYRPTRWGRFVTTASREFSAEGHPEVVADPRLRGLHPITGHINPSALVESGFHALEVREYPEPAVGEPTPWQGMSGAAVLCDDLVVGVVVIDPPGFGGRRILAASIAPALADDTFLDLVLEHTGARPTAEAVEFEAIRAVEIPSPSPAGLLRAAAAVAPFRSRPELESLSAWCDGSEHVSTRLVTGSGGLGKTRFAYRLAAVQAERGWATVVLHESRRGDELRVLGTLRVPTLIVVDYAEGRIGQLAELYESIVRSDTRVRVLLLARTPGLWRRHLTAGSLHLEVLDDDGIVVRLTPTDTTIEGRTDAWRQAVAAFAPRLAHLSGYAGTDWAALVARVVPPRLDGETFRTTLAIQIDALAALLRVAEGTDTDRLDPRRELLRHERRYWARVADQAGLTWSASSQECLVATATLWAAPTAAAADAILLAVLRDPEDHDLRGRTSDWLATLYQDGRWFWTGLQPDRLGEYLIAQALAPGGRCASASYAADVVARPQLEHGLTVLGRAAADDPGLDDVLAALVRRTGLAGALAAMAVVTRLERPAPLLDVLDDLIATSDPATLDALADAAPYSSMTLTAATLAIARRAVELLREDPSAPESDLADAIGDLALHLSRSGRHSEAVEYAQDAVARFRSIAARSRSLPAGLARAVNTLAICLGRVGRSGAGLAAAREAVELYGALVRLDPRHGPAFAGVVDNLSVDLASDGRHSEALGVAHEAVRMRRALVATARSIFLPDLSLSLQNLANRLAELGEHVDALAVAREAVAGYREMVDDDRDAFLADAARAVNTLGVRLAESGAAVEALDVAEDAVSLYDELVGRDRRAHLPGYAQALVNRALRYREAGRDTEALADAERGAELYRELVRLDEAAHGRELAVVLDQLAFTYSDAGRHAEALAVSLEAVAQHRALPEEGTGVEQTAFARLLSNTAVRLVEAGRAKDALAYSEEAVHSYTILPAERRAAVLEEYARALMNLFADLVDAGSAPRAIAVASEAVVVYRELLRRDPSRHLYALARTLAQLTDLQTSTGALANAAESVEVLRELVPADRSSHLPLLARVVRNLAVRLAEAQRTDEALSLTREAVTMYREMAATDPAEHRPRLAETLLDLAVDLGRSAEFSDAVIAATEASTIFAWLARVVDRRWWHEQSEADALAARLRLHL